MRGAARPFLRDRGSRAVHRGALGAAGRSPAGPAGGIIWDNPRVWTVMKLGIMIEGQEGLTWERWRRIAAATEDLGFDSLWRSDHVLSILDPGRDSLETWATLAVAAAETRRIRLGPLVCPMTFRHPALLAKQAAAVDRLSGGRLVLGVGAGWNDVEHQAFGLAFPPLGERMDRLEEGIEVIRRLMGDGPADFAGRYYQIAGVDARPKPVQRPAVPILIGGTGERRTLRIVARYADEWDLPGGVSPAAYRVKADRLAAYCREIGRDPAAIRRSCSTAYIIGRDAGEIERRAGLVGRLVPTLAGVDPARVIDTLRLANWLIGTPADMVAHFRALAREGVHRVVLQHNDQDDLASLELIAAEVLPVIAGWAEGGPA